MIKLSVKKPITIFVVVIIIIALGVVSLIKMTPDLLPSIDLPYIVVMTTYPGATPAEVEAGVSKPLERTLSTLEGLKNLMSTSNANYSLVVLEFENGTSMDTAIVNTLQSIDTVKGRWDDMVGTPYIMKLNPNMLPISVVSVDRDGYDIEKLSTFVNDTLINKLEGTTGVASVSAGGILQSQLNVKISEDKIEKLNDKLVSKINKEFGKARTQIKSGLSQINDGIKQIDAGKEQAAAQFSQMPSTIINPQYQMVLAQIEAATDPDEKAALEASLAGIDQYIDNPYYAQAEEQYNAVVNELDSKRAELVSTKSQLNKTLNTVNSKANEALKSTNIGSLISVDMISKILQAQNFSMPAGYIQEGDAKYLVSVGNKITTLEEANGLFLFNVEGIGDIRLSDVADVFMSDNSDKIYASINGNSGVLLSFSKQSNYATAKVSNTLKDKFEKLSNEYEGLHFSILMDQGDYIYLIIEAILESLLYGALFAVIVLFIFLKSIKPTFITLLSIPISIMLALALMYFSGVTLNMISLSGLAVAVGMLVDNSIVVIENIFRMRRLGIAPKKAAIAGAKEVGGAIISSTLTTVCVFAPIIFVTGLTRQLFTDMALTIAYALTASLLIALTLVPAMSSMMFTNDVKPEGQGFVKFKNSYRKLLNWNLNHKALILIVVIGLLGFSVYGSVSRGFIFMPEMSTPQMNGSVTMDKEDSTVAETAEVCDKVVERIAKVEGVQTVGAMLSSSGLSGLSGSTSTSSVSLYIIVDPDTKRSGKEIAEECVNLASDLPCEVNVASTSSVMSYSTALSGSGVSIKLYGTDQDSLQEAAKLVAAKLETVEGIESISDGLEKAEAELHFTVSKDKAMAKGLTVAQVYMAVANAMTTNSTSTTVTFGGDDYDIIVADTNDGEVKVNDLLNLKLKYTDASGKEKSIKLTDIATVEYKQSLPRITRDNQRMYLNVSGTVKAGKNVTLVTTVAENALKDIELPAGVSYEFDGENEMIMDAMSDLALMLLLGVLLVYLVMVAQFQSLKSPFIVMFTIPLAFTGGLLALLIFGKEISVIAMIGLILLVGVIVNNGIVLVDYTNQLRARGLTKRQAIIEAAATRMRPVMMTSLTTILGLIIMAAGKTAGTDMMQPIALVCIGGLLYATLLTLLVVPIIYDIFNGEKYKATKREDLDITGLIADN